MQRNHHFEGTMRNLLEVGVVVSSFPECVCNIECRGIRDNNVKLSSSWEATQAL